MPIYYLNEKLSFCKHLLILTRKINANLNFALAKLFEFMRKIFIILSFLTFNLENL